MCVYIHINIHVYTYIHIYRYIRVCIYTHLLNTCIHDCMKIYVHLCDMSRAPIYARATTHILFHLWIRESGIVHRSQNKHVWVISYTHKRVTHAWLRRAIHLRVTWMRHYTHTWRSLHTHMNECAYTHEYVKSYTRMEWLWLVGSIKL